jgi:hypothetical protein
VDTDGDGLEDNTEIAGWEIEVRCVCSFQYLSENMNLNYRWKFEYQQMYVSSHPSYRDTDNDGLLDNMEYKISTNPSSSDTDCDYMDDAYEYNYEKESSDPYGLDPLDAEDANRTAHLFGRPWRYVTNVMMYHMLDTIEWDCTGDKYPCVADRAPNAIVMEERVVLKPGDIVFNEGYGSSASGSGSSDDPLGGGSGSGSGSSNSGSNFPGAPDHAGIYIGDHCYLYMKKNDWDKRKYPYVPKVCDARQKGVQIESLAYHSRIPKSDDNKHSGELIWYGAVSSKTCYYSNDKETERECRAWVIERTIEQLGDPWSCPVIGSYASPSGIEWLYPDAQLAQDQCDWYCHELAWWAWKEAGEKVGWDCDLAPDSFQDNGYYGYLSGNDLYEDSPYTIPLKSDSY